MTFKDLEERAADPTLAKQRATESTGTDEKKVFSISDQITRPTGARALAGWLVLAAFSFAATIPVYLQGAPVWAVVLTAVMVAGLVLSGILMTPLGIMVAAIMVVYQTVVSSPLIAITVAASLYGITIIGNLLVLRLVWGGALPKVFRDKGVNRLTEEPLSEDYKIGVVSNLWGLHWGGVSDDYSLPVIDDSLLSSPPGPLKSLARQLASDEHEQEFASVAANTESSLAMFLRNELGVTTSRLDPELLPRLVAFESRTSSKRVKQVSKTATEAGVDAKATLDLVPEIRVLDDQDWSDGNKPIYCVIGFRWELDIYRLEGKANHLFTHSGAVHREKTLPAPEWLAGRLVREMRATVPQLRDQIAAALATPSGDDAVHPSGNS